MSPELTDILKNKDKFCLIDLKKSNIYSLGIILI